MSGHENRNNGTLSEGSLNYGDLCNFITICIAFLAFLSITEKKKKRDYVNVAKLRMSNYLNTYTDLWSPGLQIGVRSPGLQSAESEERGRIRELGLYHPS